MINSIVKYCNVLRWAQSKSIFEKIFQTASIWVQNCIKIPEKTIFFSIFFRFLKNRQPFFGFWGRFHEKIDCSGAKNLKNQKFDRFLESPENVDMMIFWRFFFSKKFSPKKIIFFSKKNFSKFFLEKNFSKKNFIFFRENFFEKNSTKKPSYLRFLEIPKIRSNFRFFRFLAPEKSIFREIYPKTRKMAGDFLKIEKIEKNCFFRYFYAILDPYRGGLKIFFENRF